MEPTKLLTHFQQLEGAKNWDPALGKEDQEYLLTHKTVEDAWNTTPYPTFLMAMAWNLELNPRTLIKAKLECVKLLHDQFQEEPERAFLQILEEYTSTDILTAEDLHLKVQELRSFQYQRGTPDQCLDIALYAAGTQECAELEEAVPYYLLAASLATMNNLAEFQDKLCKTIRDILTEEVFEKLKNLDK